MTAWDDQGCPYCRGFFTGWTNRTPDRLGQSMAYQCTVYRCTECHAFWAEGMAYPHEITIAEARLRLPELDLT